MNRHRVLTAHTADLDMPTLEAARALLDAVFEGDMTDARPAVLTAA
ncbi:MAG: hypothetical protein M3433_01535 [Actinomycetota bacterium]|nr:hypothetical protein [Actinomycetota bacterium]